MKSIRNFGCLGIPLLAAICTIAGHAETGREANGSLPSSIPQYWFTHLAGPLGGPGNVDGIGTAARFNNPSGVAVDGAGTVFVTDTTNLCVRRIDATGRVSTLAGGSSLPGSADGTGPVAQFNEPSGGALDRAGNYFLADTNNHTIRKITPAGVVSTFAGSPGQPGSADGVGTHAQFNLPADVAVDAADNVYVADTHNRTVRKITPDGTVTTLAGQPGVFGSVDGTGTAAEFVLPTGLAVDAVGDIIVVDQGAFSIRKITPDGVVVTLAVGDQNGGKFSFPSDAVVDRAGNIYIADIYYDTIWKLTPAGQLTPFAGSTRPTDPGSEDGRGTAARFNHPINLTIDQADDIYVADQENHAIRKITPDGTVTTLAGLAGGFGDADGPSVQARFRDPVGVALDGAGNVYAADWLNQTIRKISADGQVTTFAGGKRMTGSIDGTGTNARFNYPIGVAVDKSGNVYEADQHNHTIRKISPTGDVTTLAGLAGVPGSADGPGAQARFNEPVGLALDQAGILFVTDALNNTVRAISPDGTVRTLAGTAGVAGGADGTGSAAQFNLPYGVAVDGTDTVYVTDQFNGTIRKITPEGVVTTLAGTPGQLGYQDGVGSNARFYSPYGLAADKTGNLFVCDGSNTLRFVTTGGAVSTIAGSVGNSGSTDGVGAETLFYFPVAVAVDTVGSLYIADFGNNAIRKGQLAGAPAITAQPQSQTVAPGGNAQFSVTAVGVPNPTYQWYVNGSLFNGANSNTLSFTSARSPDAGDYTVVVTNTLGSVTSAKATLTVSSASAPLPSNPSSSSGGTAGGGSMDACFALTLLALGTRMILGRAGKKGCTYFPKLRQGADASAFRHSGSGMDSNG